ncbi:hypothetical protein DL764_002886 [Monosporascus ibericus]|uniref:Uncharacterized protein n=1 Tax=Monosporascus ibericus TaxID=155417 RepID=A0A4Q4TJT6_9PEZI|nr:hypothetical protein DL764_002886 [Monosporascus ibericus]
MAVYVPPFRRGQAEGSSSDSPSAVHGFRGGGGGSQGQQSRGPPVDQANLYHKDDIANHFFGGEDPHRSSHTRSTSLNDSAAHPGELSSDLNLLPEYAAKMLEHGPRGSPWDIPPGATQGHALESHHKADKPAAGGSITDEAANRTIDDANKTEKRQVMSKEESPPTEASLGSSLIVTNDQSRESPIPIDGLKDANASAAELTRSTSSSSRTKYTEIPTIPAEEFENKKAQNVSTFSSIQPIQYIPSAHPPVAVFEERWNPWSSECENNVRFAFSGWYKVARVHLFAPHSAELLWMLQQKWERRDNFGRVMSSGKRFALALNNAMSMQWAVVKFEKLAGDMPPPLAIEKLPRTPRDVVAAAKGVNEMLAEMRMGNSSSSKEVGAHEDGDEGPRETEIPGKQEAPDG